MQALRKNGLSALPHMHYETLMASTAKSLSKSKEATDIASDPNCRAMGAAMICAAVALLLAGCETCKCVDEVPPPVEYGQL